MATAEEAIAAGIEGRRAARIGILRTQCPHPLGTPSLTPALRRVDAETRNHPMTFKPMLACAADLSSLRFPLLASPKFDGIRCAVVNGEPLTRSLKPIPNRYLRERLRAYADLDGELVLGNPKAKDCFQRTTSAVMSHDGEPTDVIFWVFDCISRKDDPFHERLRRAWTSLSQDPFGIGRLVEHTSINDTAALDAYEAEHVAAGWEGVMLRDPYGAYKCGRSTAREGGLLKVKRFTDAEATVVGVEEQMHNENEAKTNALGLTERSSCAEGLRAHGAGYRDSNTLGRSME